MDKLRESENPTEATRISLESDSRVKGLFRPKVTTPDGKFERTYCFLCGKPWGWCSVETSNLSAPSHIVVTCDDCDKAIVEKYANGDLSKFPLKPVPGWLLEAFGMVPEKEASTS